jgi:hypothetical protein
MSRLFNKKAGDYESQLQIVPVDDAEIERQLEIQDAIIRQAILDEIKVNGVPDLAGPDTVWN